MYSSFKNASRAQASKSHGHKRGRNHIKICQSVDQCIKVLSLTNVAVFRVSPSSSANPPLSMCINHISYIYIYMFICI